MGGAFQLLGFLQVRCQSSSLISKLRVFGHRLDPGLRNQLTPLVMESVLQEDNKIMFKGQENVVRMHEHEKHKKTVLINRGLAEFFSVISR